MKRLPVHVSLDAGAARHAATVRLPQGGWRARRRAADLMRDGPSEDSGESMPALRRELLQPPDTARLEPAAHADHATIQVEDGDPAQLCALAPEHVILNFGFFASL